MPPKTWMSGARASSSSQRCVVENGEIAAVLIGEDVTLKKVFLSKDLLKLVPANDDYEPFIYSAEEAENIRIIGKAVAILKNIK